MRGFWEIDEEHASLTVLRFAADARRRAWVLLDSHCDDPTCSAAESHIRLIPPADPEVEPVEFQTKRVGAALDHRHAPGCLEHAIVREIAQTACLRNLLERRRQLVRAWALSRWDGPRIRLGQDTVIPFEDVSPTKERLLVPFQSAEGKDAFVADAYCVRPECPCSDAYFHIYVPEAGVEKLHPACVAKLDLATDARSHARGRPLAPNEAGLVDAFLSDLGEDWKGELTTRRDFLREAVLRRWGPGEARRSDRQVESSIGPTGKPGRNAPCPCGSGLKFKNCCLRVGQR